MQASNIVVSTAFLAKVLYERFEVLNERFVVNKFSAMKIMFFIIIILTQQHYNDISTDLT